MEKSERGRKHICPDCTTKYYDLKKDVVTCPRCGAAPAAPKTARRRPGRRTVSNRVT